MPETAPLIPHTLALLEKLVAFDSVSRNSNLPMIEFIESYLYNLGIPTQRAPSPGGVKTNLLARIGPEVAGGIILSGHSDVVPVDGQTWDSDPFTLTRKGNTLYGRGTSDMKSFLAVCLAMAPIFQEAPLKKPIWLAFSYDEEVGCLGAPHLLDYIVQHIPKPAFAIIGEPTLMQVVTAHKGVLSFETAVHGLEGHSSQPQRGVNAVHIACELVNFLSSLSALSHRERGGASRDEGASTQRLPEGIAPHPNPLPEGEGIKYDARFDPPYSTVHVGTIHGGTARNIIPKECHFQWEIRPLPGDDPDTLISRFHTHCDKLMDAMRKIYPDATILTRPMSRMTGVTLPESAHAAAQLVMRCAQTNAEHAVSFGTEAGVFNDHGVPAIICGPGSIEQAHKPNEWIDIAQIEACIGFMQRLTDALISDT